ncbi:MAG: hypothetical protein HKL96_00825 [Phycisphaerales bacterium]|nr:hypothetical protein [Phycisphaerales bacterium]
MFSHIHRQIDVSSKLAHCAQQLAQDIERRLNVMVEPFAQERLWLSR